MEKNNTNLMIVAIVAIVAIVGIVIMVGGAKSHKMAYKMGATCPYAKDGMEAVPLAEETTENIGGQGYWGPDATCSRQCGTLSGGASGCDGVCTGDICESDGRVECQDRCGKLKFKENQGQQASHCSRICGNWKNRACSDEDEGILDV